MQIPDTRLGHYYVSAIDAGKYYLMSGPYELHQTALNDVKKVRQICDEIHPKSIWMAFGTCRVEINNKPGKLQELGLFDIGLMPA